MHPTKAHPAAQPSPAASRRNNWPKYPIAPLITMLSYPNRKPPRVATLAAMKRGARERAGLDGTFRLFDPMRGRRWLRAGSLGRFDDRLRRQHEAESVGHPSVPGRGTRHLRRVVRNEHAVEAVAVQDRENANHVHIAFVDEGFAIVRHLPRDIAEMDICNLALFAVLIHRVVNIAFGHFG